MSTVTRALSKTQKIALGICAAVASAVVALGSIGAGAATIGAQPVAGQRLEVEDHGSVRAALMENPELLARATLKPTPEKPPVYRV